MIKYFIRRFLYTVLILFITTSLTFIIVRYLPGDPIAMWVGDKPTKEQLEIAKESLGFNEPVSYQYVYFLKNVITLNWGVSLRTKQPVIVELISRFSATFELVIFSLFFALTIGFPLGLLSALKAETLYDKALRGFAYLGLSIPIFWLAMVLQIIFFSLLNILPLQGRYSNFRFLENNPNNEGGFLLLNSMITGQWDLFFNGVMHIILPATVMCFGVLGIVLRTTRSALIDTMKEPFFKTYLSFGFTENQAVIGSAYKNTLIPVSTVTGLSFGFMLGGTFLVESVFDWPGLGQFSVLSILTNDFPSIIGITILYTFIYILINFSIDILYSLLDPRFYE